MKTQTLSRYDIHLSPAVDQVNVEERIARFTKRSIKTESKGYALRLALSMMDLTTRWYCQPVFHNCW